MTPRFLSTEEISPRYADLDAWPTVDAIEAMWEGQVSAVAAVRPLLPLLADAVDAAAAALGSRGRLVYVGAGTSGRIGVQDGAELPPTFDWPFERLAFAMAGGFEALVRSAEGAEDDEAAGRRAIVEADVGPQDVVIGLAASGNTPFTVAAMAEAAERDAVTIGIVNNLESALVALVRFPLTIDTGPEIVAGSTRMKAGTAQKAVLNLFSTALMVRLGRVFGSMMVDMRTSNAKLRRRAETMVRRITGCGPARATEALRIAEGNVKVAVLVAFGADRQTATALLVRENGNLRRSIAAFGARAVQA